MTNNQGQLTKQRDAMQVLVTGATGAVGPRVVEALLAAGHRVRVLVRQPVAPGLWPATVEQRVGNITDVAALCRAMEDCAGVIHMAALLHINMPSAALARDYAAINVAGTVNVLQAAVAQGVQRVVFFSSISVFGRACTGWLTEAATPLPDTPYGTTKLAAEAHVLAARRSTGEALGVVLRPAAVYGTRVKGNYQRLLYALARGRFLPIGKGTNRRTLVYDRDLAAAALLALQHPAAAGSIYHVTDGTVHTLQAIMAAICGALGRRPPCAYVPIAPVRGAMALLEDGCALVGRNAPLGRATLDKYLAEITVDGSRMQQELGFVPRYALAAGWAELIQELGMAEQGWRT